MKIIKSIGKFIYVLLFFCMVGGCGKEIEVDDCLLTKWPQPKQVELKLAVHMVEQQPLLPGGTANSESPTEWEEMVVNGTIEKIDCYYDQTIGPVSLGNSYLVRGIDLPAPLGIRGVQAYWIGHIVFVYEFGNDADHLNINLTVKITMKDKQAYQCNVSKDIFYHQIFEVPGEMYSYVLLDIYSDNWMKI